MSVESPNRSRSRTRSTSSSGGGGGGVTTASGPAVVNPQQVTDPTILDSVAGFINDVVPTAYNVTASDPTKDQIQWVHFEQLELDESTFAPDYDNDAIAIPTIVLILGYATGIQVWAVPASGEATEILSWRHGNLRTMRIIPNPHRIGGQSGANTDLFAVMRPLIALCDLSTQYLAVNFHSLRTGESVKPIRFQTPVLNILANRRSVVIAFAEKFAVFDSFTLEPRISVTTCYLSPGLQQNPIALGSRWLAYAEKKLNTGMRSGGGNEGEGVQSYTATVLHAAKSFSRGLRELGETVASSLTGNIQTKPGTSPNSPQAGGMSDVPQKGIISILDIENKSIDSDKNFIPPEAIVAHFIAHTEALVCLSFDPSGLLLLTADKRGHDFHLFRIQPHPMGAALAAIHHLYILHRGDTTAKVQDMCFAPDSRWVTVSTLRGTTHVFPITPYGGNVGVRTHGTPLVVNKMSRFHRSAGLSVEGGRSNSPVSLNDTPANSLFPYHNPRFPPYPLPVVMSPIAQIRQPVLVQNGGGVSSLQQRTQHNTTGRQRLSSSEDNIALKVVACFSQPRAWIDSSVRTTEPINKQQQIKPVESLFIMSCHGVLIQYDLDPRPVPSVPKERICNDTPIELRVSAKAQWLLQRQPHTKDIPMPMLLDNLKFVAQDVPLYKKSKPDHNDDSWLSQVEIVTHSGPHRRLWMGPQFTFKTYVIANGAVVETRALDVRRSKPVNMPISKANAILIESGSASSCEQLFLDTYQRTNDEVGGGAGTGAGEIRLKEDLADAMLESPGVRETGGHCVIVSMKPHTTTIAKVVNPLGTVVTVHHSSSDEDIQINNDMMDHLIDDEDDRIIHENCDEALFRPVVPAKPLYYSDDTTISMKSKLYNNIIHERMLTKNLEANTEVAVKIINQNNHNNNCDDKINMKSSSLKLSGSNNKINKSSSTNKKNQATELIKSNNNKLSKQQFVAGGSEKNSIKTNNDKNHHKSIESDSISGTIKSSSKNKQQTATTVKSKPVPVNSSAAVIKSLPLEQSTDKDNIIKSNIDDIDTFLDMKSSSHYNNKASSSNSNIKMSSNKFDDDCIQISDVGQIKKPTETKLLKIRKNIETVVVKPNKLIVKDLDVSSQLKQSSSIIISDGAKEQPSDDDDDDMKLSKSTETVVKETVFDTSEVGQLKKTELKLKQSNTDNTIQIFDNDDDFIISSKVQDQFEDASSDIADNIIDKSSQDEKIDCSLIEPVPIVVVEEKSLTSTRKSRKPKTKLGVKIPPTSSGTKITMIDSTSTTTTKRAWNNVVAAPILNPLVIINDNNDDDDDDDNQKLLLSDETKPLLVDLDQLSDTDNDTKTDLMMMIDQPPVLLSSSLNDDDAASSDCDLMKLDKLSSDDDDNNKITIDDKISGDTTTESGSDDSTSKLPAPSMQIFSVMDTEEDNITPILQINNSLSTTKSANKRKSKKKRK